MAAAAPRISRRLLETLVRLDDRSVPIAETYRRVGEEADRRGLTRPSYQRIRVLIHQARRQRAQRGQSTAELLLEVMAQSRPPEALIDRAAGIPVYQLRRHQDPK
jgi:hypothetical protein